ncbi:MAG TPA: ABC transporter substrate-binding protein [Candidatus Baltobacteraceae bacterium]|nr:ABC transporter substrate-binding protein [Candidatus Baltobacteraceae bacterium]
MRTFRLVLIAVLVLIPAVLRAETSELRIAKQYGLGYLQMMLMEEQKLVEKHAKAAGLGDLKVTWATFRSSDVMNDALLSGSLEFASVGGPGLATIWAKTRGTAFEVKGASGFNFLPLALVTRDPRIKSLSDYTDKDRIAVPAIKVSNQAILLQMAAAKLYGQANYTKFDSIAVTMAHPDAMAALLSGAGEIGSHFASAPFLQKELERPNIRKITTSTEIVGSPIPFNIIAATSKFYTANPKTYAAFLAALQEATDLVNKDKRAAAELYIRVTKDKSTPDELLKIMNDQGNEYSLVPKGNMPMIEFMHKIGTIKVKPETWKDLFFPNVHNQPGS